MNLQAEVESQYVAMFAEENDVDLEYLWEAMEELDARYDFHEGWYGVDTDALLARAREMSSTWEAHYNSTMGHHPEQCYYCARAEVA